MSVRRKKQRNVRNVIGGLLSRIGYLYLALTLVSSGVVLARPHDLEETEPEWLFCLTELQSQAGIPRGVDTARYLRQIVTENPVLVKYVIALIYVESRFRTGAISKRNAQGLMQLTPPAVHDAAVECNIQVPTSMSKLLIGVVNVKYGTCYLLKLHREMKGDWVRILLVYNGGYEALRSYERGDSINSESANYVLAVHRALQSCSQKQKED